MVSKTKDIIALIYWHRSEAIVQTTELNLKSQVGETGKHLLATERYPGLHLRADFLKSQQSPRL